MSSNFSEVPILDYSLTTDPARRPEFIVQLEHALINVGFLYLSNPPVSKSDTASVIGYAPKLFDLPQGAKDKISMVNSPHFLGYTRLGSELTKGRTDQREQYDFATRHVNRWKPGDPDYLKLWGPAQWPDEEDLPGFQETFLRYIDQVADLSNEFVGFIAEAFRIDPRDMDVFFEKPDRMQHRAKVVKYPTLDDVSSDQGVGPHFDSGFLTFLLQASSHAGLQVQNLSGDWIDVPPIDGTFVVNIGKGLESVTRGLARATSHRVLSPSKGSSPRYSVPFFQNIAQQIRLSEIDLKIPPEILALKETRGNPGATDSINYAEYDLEVTGKVSLIGRIKSHPDVAERHYSDLFKQLFPSGLIAQGSAY